MFIEMWGVLNTIIVVTGLMMRPIDTLRRAIRRQKVNSSTTWAQNWVQSLTSGISISNKHAKHHHIYPFTSLFSR